MKKSFRWSLAALSLAVAGCAHQRSPDSGEPVDAGAAKVEPALAVEDAGAMPAAEADAGLVDAGMASAPMLDAGTAMDAGMKPDAGLKPDAGAAKR